MFTFTVKQEGPDTDRFLENIKRMRIDKILDQYAQAGVQALASATPVDSGETAASWGYEIESNSNGCCIYWTNDHINKGVNIAVILQYGHGTGTGGYVQGRDYINPTIAPIFDQIANDAWNEVTNVR